MSQHLYDRYGRLFDPNADLIQRPSIQRASLRGASGWLLNTLGAPGVGPSWQGDRPSVFQNLPLDADTLLRWLGGGAYPAGFGIANVLAIYLCNTASPLVDSLGLGPNLVAAGGPLTGRECVGLGQAGSWTSKVGVEALEVANQGFSSASNFMEVNANIRAALVVFRLATDNSANNRWALGTWYTAYGWEFILNPTRLRIGLQRNLNPGLATTYVDVAATVNDGAWHCGALFIDAVAGNAQLFSDLGDSALTAWANTLIPDDDFALASRAGSGLTPPHCQVAYLACFDRALTSAMRAAFWRHAQVPVPFLHARTNPLVCPISPSRVACYSGGNVGQAAVGYDASLVSAALGNPLGSGYVADVGETFEPIGSDKFYGNTAVAGGCARASVDGPSGMRDGCRVTMGGAWAAGVNGYLIAGGVAIAGASNVPWRQDMNYRRATVNTTARHGLYFTGDGGGPEFFTLVADAAAPVDWTRAGGTCTPVGAAHNVFFTQYGAAANLDDCDFGEPAVVKNRATAPLAWRRVGTAAAAVTTTPAITVNNGTNRYYNALTGSFKFTIGGFQGVAGATFFSFGAVGAAGALVCDYNAGQMRVRIYDNAGALAATLLCGPVTNARHEYSFDWSTQAPLRNIGGAYAAVSEGATVLSAWLATWTPAVTAPATLYIGTDSAGANPARCFIELA